MIYSKEKFNFQASRFGIILGLFGLGNIWKQSVVFFQNWVLTVSEVILISTLILWFFFTISYILKWILNFEEAIQEFKNPIKNNYIGLLGATMILNATTIHNYYPILGKSLFFLGIIIQLGYGILFTEQTWKNSHEIKFITPSLYLPTVAGNFISAIVAGMFHYNTLGYFFLGIGFFSWLTLESIIMNRLKNEKLHPEYKPTLGIMMAPPAIACAACLALNLGEINILIKCLLGYALFHLLIFLKIFFSILKEPFNLSFWAFSFGLTTVTNVTMQYSKKTNTIYINDLMFVLFIIANLIIGYLIIKSLVFLKDKTNN
jgi:tellurite resistance protein